jgi:hypothetical protein
VKVAVAPAVGARIAAKRVRAGRRAVLTGTLRPSKPAVIVQISRQIGKRFVRAAALRFKTRSGRYRAVVPLRRPGLYRLRVTFRGDRRNAAARGPDAYVRAVRRLSSARAARAAR